MVNFGEAVGLFFRRAFDFNGRSTRAEYWWAQLFLVIVYLALMTACLLLIGPRSGTNDMAIGSLLIILVLFWLITVVPNTALFVRRLHDANMSGWIYLAIFFGGLIFGLFAMIAKTILACMEGTKGPNKYGEDPYGRAAIIETFS